MSTNDSVKNTKQAEKKREKQGQGHHAGKVMETLSGERICELRLECWEGRALGNSGRQ